MNPNTTTPPAARLAAMKRFIEGLGVLSLRHSKSTYWDHLEGIYRDLESWGCDEAVCAAGIFHSIYGTEQFAAFALPLDRRDDVRAVIGDRAEYLAWLNCFVDRATFDDDLRDDRRPRRVRHRVDGVDIELDDDTFDDLCRLHLCDWLESVVRIDNWSYRGDAYARLAAYLGGPAKLAYEREDAARAAATDSRD